MKTLLSFVVPCYRSELTIEKVTCEIIETVSQRTEYDYEIVCVNDCSPDGVYEVLKRLAQDNSKIKVINFARNMGKHSAVLAGFAHAKGEYIVNVDDDFQCPVNELWRLMEPIENDECDFATAKKCLAVKELQQMISFLEETVKKNPSSKSDVKEEYAPMAAGKFATAKITGNTAKVTVTYTVKKKQKKKLTP